MPSVKLPKKSTFTDMTPFVDIAFLILSFFIMATKFKPPETVTIETPGSVLTQELPKTNAVMISFDSLSRVFFTVLSEKDESKYATIIEGINNSQKLGLTPSEIANFKNVYMTGVPFSNLKQILGQDAKLHKPETWAGIPVLDTANNQLEWWIRESITAFRNEKLDFLIKGDNDAKYPAFEAVLNALKKNEQFKYKLITSLDGVPSGSALAERERQKK
jgi:biopolymer transport protein ExbD